MTKNARMFWVGFSILVVVGILIIVFRPQSFSLDESVQKKASVLTESKPTILTKANNYAFVVYKSSQDIRFAIFEKQWWNGWKNTSITSEPISLEQNNENNQYVIMNPKRNIVVLYGLSSYEKADKILLNGIPAENNPLDFEKNTSVLWFIPNTY